MTDVNTGKIEKVLEHNMVTNALTEIFKPLGLAKDPSLMLREFAPYYQNCWVGFYFLTVKLRKTQTISFLQQKQI